jgi:acetyl/propionyl-CoA carboxylase alpha subunit
MRVVERPEDLLPELRAARSESLSSFGSDHILIEKYFTEIRHIEVQVLGDIYGHIIHLFERECSIQRRHQKLVEESPSPAVTPELREAMCRAALGLARSVGYVSAGTLEFVLTPDGNFYFLEMNTRLQVEHPVTELVTGLDLAAWQIRLAAGERLTVRQEDVTQRGHALECRVYAEDPAAGFLPSIGVIEVYRRPSGPGVRVDDGVEAGTIVSPYYDPMIGKVITWGQDRPEAIRKMIRALQDTVVLGVIANIPYLIDLLRHPEFVAGRLSTRFLDKHLEPWRPAVEPTGSTWLALAAYEALRANGATTDARVAEPGEPETADPWRLAAGWRNVLGQSSSEG